MVGSWDVEFAAGLNQADHRVAGLAAVDALRDAGNRWVFTELLDQGLEPWSPRWLLVGGDQRPTHGVDVTGEPLERGIASLECHREYLAGIPDEGIHKITWDGRDEGGRDVAAGVYYSRLVVGSSRFSQALVKLGR